ncbi:MAG: gspF, partial [Planctomycetaceae bacterium]|nr:gspF [Planctomycetaceae bacterium]
MQFSYSAKSMQGQLSNGTLDADSIATARQQLRERGLFPLKLAPLAEKRAQIVVARRGIFKARVKKPEIMLLTSQLVIMCSAGVDLAESLHNVAANCKNPTLKDALDSIYQDVSQGLSFSAAMKKQTGIFGEAYVASIAAGEASGRVPEVLARMAAVLQNEIKLSTTVKSAMAYPLVLMGVCVIVIIALVLFVLPNFENVFIDMGVTPPPSTQLLLGFSAELRRHIWLWGAGAVGGMFVAFKILWTPTVLRYLENVAMQMVLFGDVLQSLVAGRLFVMLGTMLQSGVPLIQSLQLCRSAMGSICYRELLDEMQTEVLNGRSIGR